MDYIVKAREFHNDEKKDLVTEAMVIGDVSWNC